MPALIFLVFAVLMMGYGMTVPGGREDRRAALEADSVAVDLLNYRQALTPYVSANPQFDGEVSASQLIWPAGAQVSDVWRHRVIRGTVYIYEAGRSNRPDLLASLAQKVGQSPALGRNSACTFVSADGRFSGPLPVTLCAPGGAANLISDGAIVIIGL